MLELGILVAAVVLALYGGEHLWLAWERWRQTRRIVRRLRRYTRR